MSKLEKLKEELNWLKVLFALLLVSNFSLLAWLVQNYFKESESDILYIASGTVIIIMIILILITKIARKKINELEDL
ncbi:hypothetical protein JHD48_00915 [Sulfurimonas sp. SAG-AH-194-I05]|nr:hypothetical protein [Sulfurimonas sp. SAG-AH-194-I05]MDF1874289.1 hypothetical protein [Sulfurimonas sp. SAG-AH-194-I05]